MKRDTKIIAAVLAAITAAILGATLACTYAVAHGASPHWRLLFRVMCHGLPRRCLTLWNTPMPICARCFATYAGMLASVAVYAVTRVRTSVAKVLLAIAAVAMAIDGFSQLTGLRESTNLLRVITGLGVGMAFGIWALAAMQQGAETASIREFTSS